MSLKRRDITAVILLVLASVLWGALVELNQNGSHSTGRTGINETGVYIQMTTSPVTVPREPLPSGTLESEPASTERYEAQGSTLVGKLIRCILGFSSFALAVGGIFLLRQRRPIFGPDGALALLAAGVWLYDSFRFMEYILSWPMSFWFRCCILYPEHWRFCCSFGRFGAGGAPGFPEIGLLLEGWQDAVKSLS